jgi:peptidoglycan/LPS O-acetylase OafA/YrhL
MLLDRIRRVTRDGRWIPEIDGLRFVAIASVLLFHLSGELQQRSGRIISIDPRYAGLFHLIDNGECGVSLFFIISGFILALPFARHLLQGTGAVSLRKYYLRRVTRLEPPYLLSVLLFMILLAGYAHRFNLDEFRHGAATAFYLHGLIYGKLTPINPVSWSLEVEIQFYIAAPLFMQLFRVRPAFLRRVSMVCLIVGIGFAQRLLVHSPRATLSILFYAQFFLMGLFLADLYLLRSSRIRSSLVWDAAGIAGLGCALAFHRDFVDIQLLMPWMLALLCVAAMHGVVVKLCLSNPWIATTGGMCYSIYLMHFQMIAAVFKFTRRCVQPGFDFLTNYLIQLLVTGVPVLAISLVFYLLVERPCMDPNWPSRLWHRITGRSREEALAFDSGGISA